MDELVSIIVPVYNAAAYIEETIRAVRSQTCDAWELLLVDDGSTDRSVALIEEAMREDHRIKLLRQSKNGGAAEARNAGLKAAKGRYIAFLDADDVWLPVKLEKELAFMGKREAAFVFTAYEFGDGRAKGTGRVVHVPETLTYKRALSRTVIFTSTVLFDTRRIGKEQLMMPQVKSEDTATWWRILRSGYTAYGLNERLVMYRRPTRSLSSNKLEAVKRIWNLYRKEEKLSLAASGFYFIGWAFRAAVRRL